MKKIVLVFYFLILTFFTYGQKKCGHIEYMNALYKKNPGLKAQIDLLNLKIKESISKSKNSKIAVAPEVIYEIPVVVHVIHNNSSGAIGGHNISDAQIYSQINILNEDYRRLNIDATNTPLMFQPVAADCKIQFCLATLDPNGNPTTGINRVYNGQAAFTISEEYKLKKLSYWPNDQYLNIWTCDISNGYLGYAQFPNYSGLIGIDPYSGGDATDGVVIDYGAFGNVGSSTFPYDLGRTATHEVGHWLGLIHIWGDSFCGDDYVSDTPAQEDLTGGSSCSSITSNCFGPTTTNMIENYMDYSADACMNIFTQGQKDRMRIVLDISPRRKSLLNSSACCPVGNKFAVPYKVDFEDFTYLTDHWNILNFDASSPYTKSWTAISPGAYGQSNYAMMIENDSVYTSIDTTYVDMFESPYTDLSVATNPKLDFDLAYAYGTSSSQTDSLVILYDTGCKDKWQPYQVLYGNSLISTSRIVDNFSPTVQEWKKITVDLTPLNSKKYIKFRIAVYSKGINNLYLDNINFYKDQGGFQLGLFPNPANKFLNAEVLFSGYKDVKIEGYNMLGKRIYSREFASTTSFLETLEITDVEAGVYIFRASSGSEVSVKKVMVY